MQWYLAKLVYQIICGDGQHTPQFDEQLRLIASVDADEAITKAYTIGQLEEETFCNQKQQLVSWQFIAVSELYPVSDFIDGAEIYSSIREADDAAAYITFVKAKAAAISGAQTLFLPHLNSPIEHIAI
ncbi:MAG: hypothetical protein JWP69_192 [Flaviaesturariibacter sp.]|nr:hypothetical protein [Flaviaesturariibacter sp.]